MNAINAKRVAAGLKQEEIARELKIDRSTVAKWETGRAKPRADVLVKLARLFGCTVASCCAIRRRSERRDSVWQE